MYRRIITAGMLAAITGCVSMHDAAPQNYRFSGNDDPVNITGNMKNTMEAFGTKHEVTIFINNTPYIRGILGDGLAADIAGQQYKGKSTSASCSGRQTSDYTAEVRCIVFVGNERTVTLTF